MNSSILVVDDQKGVRQLITEAFRESGIVVETAQNGLEALERLKVSKFPLILLDMKMPGMNGLELLKRIREEGYQSRIIMMTAYEDFDFVEGVDDLQVVRSIVKPFDILELQSLVKEILAASSSV